MAGFLRGGSALFLMVWTLAACGAGTVPNDVASGVGFQDYRAWEARRAALRGEASRPVEAVVAPAGSPGTALSPAANPQPVVQTAAAPVALPPAQTAARGTDVTRIAAAAIAQAEAAPEPPASPVALASAPLPAAAPAPAIQTANAGISDEQDFDAVAERETIESDAERRARMQADRVVIPPTALPDRPDGLGPNIIDYALSTTHALGERRYTRRPVSEDRHQRSCLAFRSPDLAQEWFLQNGGPGRDRRGLDPDGDGYACGWNPAVYRAAAAAARN
jgi:hypothetical protein